jgi:hypothetical protein
MRKHFILILLLLVSFSVCINAQRWKLLRYEAGLGFGTTQIFGDIGGGINKNNFFGLQDIKFDETRLAISGNVRYKLNPMFSIKTNLYYGQGKATDLDSRNDRGRSYDGRFYEFSAQYEYYFKSEEPGSSGAIFDSRGMINNYATLSAYVFAGIGVTYSVFQHDAGDFPSALDDYRATNLAPIIPFGLGIKYVIDERWYVGSEFGYRYAINDYIEGYKQLQGSKYNDMYYFFVFTANYRIKTSRRNIPAFMDRKFWKYGF